ncbi:MAG TPA: 2-hydroxyacyl-CoA dehydratase family protein [Candidatus Anoxymicrobiaceae bacterium]|jgi:benzoyl-CoA reductase/2-hydroxyglutaryl-CoA dehydratase subunit BcrC/BadD/HgdB
MIEALAHAHTGMFDRVAELFEVIDSLPENMSDEEIAGLLDFLPPDSAQALGAMFVPRVREGSIAFMRMLAIWLEDAKSAVGQGKKTILVPFCFPPELVHAFDNAFPITSEVLSTLGVVALEGQGERYYDMALGLGLPDHICSSNSIEVGSMLGSNDFQPQAIISAAVGSCDINSKTHEFVARYHDIPLFVLEKPVDNTERGLEQYRKNYCSLIAGLEEFLDEELTEDKLRPVLEKHNRCTELYMELWELHKAVPHPVPALFALYTYGCRFAMWGTDPGVEMMETIVDVSKRRLKSGDYPADREVARCLLTYTSFYFDLAGMFNWMDERGYAYMGDGLNMLFPQPVDTTDMDTMIDGMCVEGRNMPMTRQMGAPSMAMGWSDDVITAVKELSADCAIYPGHHACKQTWSAAAILRDELMKRTGVPLLVLQGDSWLKRTTPISVIQEQIDEFIKNVVVPKSSGRKKVRHRS